jgi:CRP-like cAMP-binding protein
MLGEISFFDKGPCSASLLVKDSADLLLLDRESFQKLSEDFPAIALVIVLDLMNGLSKRLRQTTGKLIDLL